jgi:transposase InsO family protein
LADCQQLFSVYGTASSMCPYDNAVVESFWGMLKAELTRHNDYQSPEKAKANLFEYLET